MSFWSDKGVLVTGAGGFLGHSVIKALHANGCGKIFPVRSSEFNLTKENEVERLFSQIKPDIVFHLAGMVGGILPNKERPAEFFYQNLLMGTFMLHHSWKNGVAKFVAAGAGCGYPENAPIPLRETDFWSGFPQKESAPYSLAKRLLTVQSEAYHRQHGFTSIVCIPGNLYGPWDNFHLLDAHVIPALVRKFVEAKQHDREEVEIWGSGKPSRDFVYVDDVAEGMLAAVEKYQRSEIVNISSGVESTITDVCQALIKITGFQGRITWNTSRPDGQLRRCFDLSKARRELGFQPRTTLVEGLAKTVAWYEQNINNPKLRK